MLEGMLLTPPERTSLLGRTLWKSRWVTFGLEPDNIAPPRPPRPSPLNQNSVSFSNANGRLESPVRGLRFASQNNSLTNLQDSAGTESMWLSIYKTKGDAKPLGRFPISSMRKCDVETMPYKKGSPAHPTLIVHFESPIRDEHTPPGAEMPRVQRKPPKEKKSDSEKNPEKKTGKKSEKKLRPGRNSTRKAAAAAAAIVGDASTASISAASAATTHTSLPAPKSKSSLTASLAASRTTNPKTMIEAVFFRSPLEGSDTILDWHDTLRPHLLITRPHTSQCQRRPDVPNSQESYLSTSSEKETSMLSPSPSVRSSVSSPYSYSPKTTHIHTFEGTSEGGGSSTNGEPVKPPPKIPHPSPNPNVLGGTVPNRDTLYSVSVYSDDMANRHLSPNLDASPRLNGGSPFIGGVGIAHGSPYTGAPRSPFIGVLPSPDASPNPDGTIKGVAVPLPLSIGNKPVPALPAGPSTGAAPHARETILDRAFQMNCIPPLASPSFSSAHNSAALIPDVSSSRGETMNSIARFEALMSELDARKAVVERNRKSSSALPPFIDQSKTASVISTPSNDGDRPVKEKSKAQKAFDFFTSGGNSARLRRAGKLNPPKTSRPTSMAVVAPPSRGSVFTLSPPTGFGPDEDDMDAYGYLPEGLRRRSSVSIAPSTTSTVATATTESTFTTNIHPIPKHQRFSISDYLLPTPVSTTHGTPILGTTSANAQPSPNPAATKRHSSLSFSSSKMWHTHHAQSPGYHSPAWGTQAPHNSTYTASQRHTGAGTNAGTSTGLGSVYGREAETGSVSSVSSLSSFGSVGSDSESLEFGCSGMGATSLPQDRRWHEKDLGGAGWRASGVGLGI